MVPKTSRFRQESGQEWAYNLAGKTNKDQANAWGLGHWGPLIGSPLASDPGWLQKEGGSAMSDHAVFFFRFPCCGQIFRRNNVHVLTIHKVCF